MTDKNILKNESGRNFRIELSFDGTDFQGWQIQQENPTVQQALQEKLSFLFAGFSVKVHGCGRTDAGVHALGYVASFHVPDRPNIPAHQLKNALNKILPSSIKIRNVELVENDFHARFSALGKAYSYVINTGEESPFDIKWSWQRRNYCKLEALREAASLLEGEHDFSAFTVKRSNIENAVRTVYRIDIQQFGRYLCLSFIGNGFLYKMIRSFVGTLDSVARGKLTPENVKEILESKDRSKGEPTCPPQGLFLIQPFYSPNEWSSFKLPHPPFHFQA